MNVVSLKPRGFTTHPREDRYQNAQEKREPWSNESKKKTPTRTGRVAHSSQEFCISVGSYSHEPNTPMGIKLSAAIAPVKRILKK